MRRSLFDSHIVWEHGGQPGVHVEEVWLLLPRSRSALRPRGPPHVPGELLLMPEYALAGQLVSMDWLPVTMHMQARRSLTRQLPPVQKDSTML